METVHRSDKDEQIRNGQLDLVGQKWLIFKNK